jgi:DNA repair exonuclease SbcCD ATPase subunit
MLTIGAVTVDGFRGFPKKVTVDFDCPVTLLVAENHQGKSSLLNAIEWCLFGDDCTGAATGIRERVGWEVVNRTSKTARIQLTLVDGDRSWVIERRQKHGSKKGQSLALSYPDGKRVEGSAATHELASLIKLNYRVPISQAVTGGDSFGAARARGYSAAVL